MYVCVSQNSRDSQSWKLSKLSSCEIYAYECLRKRNKNRVPFLRQSQDQRKGRKHFSREAAAELGRATEVLSSTKTNGYKKSKKLNGNRIRVKSSRISPASLLTWTEFREKDVSFIE